MVRLAHTTNRKVQANDGFIAKVSAEPYSSQEKSSGRRDLAPESRVEIQGFPIHLEHSFTPAAAHVLQRSRADCDGSG